MNQTRILLSSAAALALLAGAGGALAATATDQTQASSPTALETVIVTARRVEEDVQRVPTTVTAVNAEQIRTQNIVAVMDLQTVSPSLSVASYFNDLNERFAVRGLSAGVTTYFADAPCCGGVGSLPFMDIGSVQVLNGPQGTLFGRSSAAGAVLIYPQKPDLNEFGGLVDFTVGDFGRAQGTGVVNIPIIADHLAVRLAANANHVNGYTHLIGTSATVDGVDNQQYRATVEFKAGHFENELIASYLNVDEPATGLVFVAGNPNFASYNVAANSTKFAAVCATAVAQGFASNVTDCQNQRIALSNNIGNVMRAEIARQATGPNAARSILPSYDGQTIFNKLQHGSVVNLTNYDFGEIGPLAVNVKNIFSYDSYTSDASLMQDGLGGVAEEGAFANAFYSTFGSNNEVGNRMTPQLGPPQITYTEEFQVHTNLDDGLLIGTIGFFYQYQKAPQNFAGTTNFYKLFSGTSNTNLGYLNAVAFIDASHSSELAWFTQYTLNLDKWVHGLSLTAGYRDSWDDTLLTTLPPVLGANGTYTPGTTPTTVTTSSSGYNYTFSASEQFTSKIMGYVTVARAYVPGGVNALGQAASSLPSFTPTYAPETVLEEEIGLKTEFDIGDAHARLNFDFYNNDFSNIFQTFTGLINGTSVRYNENIAAATLRGFEVAGTVLPFTGMSIDFGYSYNDAKYTKWTGQDPFNIAKAGDPVCVSVIGGLCYLDLTNNPFPLMPANQGHITATYHLPVDPALGDLSVGGTVYAQSRVYFEATAARDMQIYAGVNGLNGISQAPYATLNLRADWKNIKGSGWNAAVFMNNVANTLYATGKIPQLETLGFSAANYAPPRMVGLEIWKKFGP